MKTSELTGAALDWMAGHANKEWLEITEDGLVQVGAKSPTGFAMWNPSTNWTQGGPIIDREGIEFVGPHDDIDLWEAVHPDYQHDESYGTTKLEAAMRCFVTSKFGEEVNIPEELNHA